MKFITGMPFTRQCNQFFLHANNKLYEGMELHTKNIRFFPEHRDHQANTQDNDGQGKAWGWKRCLSGGNIKGPLHLHAIIFFAPTSLIEKYTEGVIFRFHET